MELSDSTVERILAAYDGTLVLESCHRLSAGNMNLMFELVTQRRTLILRLIHQTHAYKLGKELRVYSLIAERTDLRVPEVVFVDRTRSIVPFGYYLMEKLPGEMLRFSPLSDEERSGLYEVLGSALAKIHSITLPEFGWVLEKGISGRIDRYVRPLPDWKSTFLDWYETIKEDLDRFENRSYGSIDKGSFTDLLHRIDRVLERSGDLIDVNADACLLHNDFTLRNVLVMRDPWRVTGVLDVEFARSGHSEFEIASLDHFLCDIDDVLAYSKHADAFLKGYTKIRALSERFEERRPVYLLVSFLSLAVYETFGSCINDEEEVSFLYRSIARILDHLEHTR